MSMTTTIPGDGKAFAHRMRRGLAAAEQQLASKVFGPKIMNWGEGLIRLGAMITSRSISPIKKVKTIAAVIAALGRADPEQAFHRVLLNEQRGRTLTLALEVIVVNEHPIKEIDGQRCAMVYRFEYLITRKGTWFNPFPILTLADHALARLDERSSERWTLETVAGLAFDLATAARCVLRQSDMRYASTELTIHITDEVVAVGAVRCTIDLSDTIQIDWLDVRTILATHMAAPQQLAQADAIAALVDARYAQADADEIERLRQAVMPVQAKLEDHVSKIITKQREQRQAAQRGAE
jgi:hypothetical protein